MSLWGSATKERLFLLGLAGLGGAQAAFTCVEELHYDNSWKRTILEPLSRTRWLRTMYQFEHWAVVPGCTAISAFSVLSLIKRAVDSCSFPEKTLTARVLMFISRLIGRLPPFLLAHPRARLFLCVFVSYTAVVAARLAWRLRGNIDAYLEMDHRAFKRDVMDFRPPRSPLITVPLDAYSAMINPVFFGVDRIRNIAHAVKGAVERSRIAAECDCIAASGKSKPLLHPSHSHHHHHHHHHTTATNTTTTGQSVPNNTHGSNESNEEQSGSSSISSSFPAGSSGPTHHSRVSNLSIDIPSSTRASSGSSGTGVIPPHDNAPGLSGPATSPSSSVLCSSPQQRAVLFVGNHAILGLELPPVVWSIYRETGMFLRGLAHTGHFHFPGWGRMVRWVGGVPGTRDMCATLMEQGHALLVYPGGTREVMKVAGEPPYRLIWGDRSGFAKLAIQHRALVVTIAGIGTNDMWPARFDLPFSWMFGTRRAVPPTIPVLEDPLSTPVSRAAHTLGSLWVDSSAATTSTSMSTSTSTSSSRSRTAQAKSSLADDVTRPTSLKAGDTSSTSTKRGSVNTSARRSGSATEATTSTMSSSSAAQAPEAKEKVKEKEKKEKVTMPVVFPPLPHQWQRYYFCFGEPIDASVWSGRVDEDTACCELRDVTKAAIERDIERLRAFQSKDPDRTLLARLWHSVKELAVKPEESPFKIPTYFKPVFLDSSVLESAVGPADSAVSESISTSSASAPMAEAV